MQLFVRAMRALMGCVLLGCLLYAPLASTQDNSTFVVRDIRIEGAQRISDGTLLNYLPINVGDELTPVRIQAAIRALYSSGFFKEIALRREGNTLVVSVLERPSIASFSLEGNKDIDSDILLDSLRSMGLAEGRLFNRATLGQVKKEMIQQYHARGKYGVRIDADVRDLGDNKVDISIDIKEGTVASIKTLDITGNKAFDEDVLAEVLELSSTDTFSFLTGDDAYDSQKLRGDLETLKSYYMDRGYADFYIESTGIEISHDFRDIYLSIAVHEGDVYTISEVKFSGQLILPESELRRFVLVKPGSVYSLALAVRSSEFIAKRLSLEGFGFATVTPVPKLDKETKTVSVTLLVEPGRRVYVNNIKFTGNITTQDIVYRREMRQLEGSWLAEGDINRSKERIRRLPYVESADYEVIPVPGALDMVDVEFDIKEREAGSFLFSIGYGSRVGALINVGVTNANTFGTGDRLSVNIARTEFSEQYQFSHTDPYSTINGVARTTSLSYSSSEGLVRNSSALDTEQYATGLVFGYPITEYAGLNFGLNASHLELLTNPTSSAELIDFVENNGDTFLSLFGPGTAFNAYELQTALYIDTRNRAIFADRGSRSQILGNVALPGSGVEYYTVVLSHLRYIPLFAGLTLGINSQIGWGEALGDTTILPPFKNFYAGGPDTVRNFRDNFLGPLDSNGFPLGGAFSTVLQTELLLPPYGAGDGGDGAARFGLYLDIGSVYATPSDFDKDLLRASTGVAATWLTPLGAMRFSYGVPIREQPGDQTERFQFTIGTVF